MTSSRSFRAAAAALSMLAVTALGAGSAGAMGFRVTRAPSKLAIVRSQARTPSQQASDAMLASHRVRSLHVQALHLAQPAAQPQTLADLITLADGREAGYTLQLDAGNAQAKLAAGGLPDLTAFDFNADALYPGAVVQGKPQYVLAGQLTTNPLLRGPGTLTITNVQFRNGTTSRHLATASQPAVVQAMQDVLRQPFAGDQAGSTSCSFNTVYSSSQASFVANASFGYMGASLSDTFKSANDRTSNHVMVFCRQEYFTFTFLPDVTTTSAGLDGFFAPGIALPLAKQYIGAGNPPLFVPSVTYGSELFMMADSKSSTSEMTNTLQAAFSYAAASGSVSVTNTQQEVAKSMTVTALAIGGRASAQFGALTTLPSGDLAQGLVSYLRSSLDIAPSRTQYQEIGLPISYKLSYLDFTPVQEVATVFGTPYQAAPARLKYARVHFHQEGDGKDWDTEADILLKDANKAIVAGMHLGKNTPFADNSNTATFTLSPTGNPPVSKQLLLDGSFDMIIHPNGHDTWNYTAYLTLYFDDGTTMTGIERDSLNQDHSGSTVMLSSFVH